MSDEPELYTAEFLSNAGYKGHIAWERTREPLVDGKPSPKLSLNGGVWVAQGEFRDGVQVYRPE